MAGINKNLGMQNSDWRKSVSQAKRSEQIRHISTILSTAEPGSTPAQKLMLSMRFEDDTFQKAVSYEDYQRILLKKLKRLQRKFKPPTQAKEDAGKSQETLMKEEEDAMEKELREKFGEKMKYIVQNAEKAVYALKIKLQHLQLKNGDSNSANNSNNRGNGSRDADLLKIHSDNIGQWAIEIGVLPESYDFPGGIRRYKNKHRRIGDLKKIKQYLEERVENIRQHVVKNADVNLYLQEEWVKLEQDMNDQMSRILRSKVKGLPNSQFNDIKKSIDRASVLVPAPRRGHPEDIKEAVLLHIKKIQAATQALMAYVIVDKNTIEMKDVLKKMHTIAVDGLVFLTNNCKKGIDEKKKEIRLEDAWNKVMKYECVQTIEDNEISSPASKRRKLGNQNIIIRTRVLLRPGQRTPSYILQALKDKNVEIIRNSEVGAGSCAKMKFGEVFEMTIFFSPLLVTFRALAPSNSTPSDENVGENAESSKESNKIKDQKTSEEVSEFRRMVVDGGLPTWKSSHSGLKTIPVLTESAAQSTYPQTPIYDMGDPIARPLIAKKLEFASFRATHVLRRCFADMTSTTTASDNNASIEISETSALMKFILLARKTFLEEEE